MTESTCPCQDEEAASKQQHDDETTKHRNHRRRHFTVGTDTGIITSSKGSNGKGDDKCDDKKAYITALCGVVCK